MPNKRAAPRDTNGRCTKCGQHHQHCAAHNRRGTPCGIAPIRGANVCWRHGGAAPQTRAAARRHLAADEATRATRRLFEQYEIDPIADPVTAFQELAAEIRTFKDFLADRVADLEENITGRTGKKPKEQVIMANVRLYIDGNRQSDINTNDVEQSSVGDYADQLAHDNGIGGSDIAGHVFSFKVDGDVADRSAKLSKLKDGALLELIDVTDYTPPEVAPATVTPEVPTAADVPDGSVDDVLEWVRGSKSHDTWNEGWGDRAAAALDAERAKGDDARKGVTEPLDKAVAEAAAQSPPS